MSVMLNTFRPKQVNEEHYNQKMNLWKEMIENYCEYKGSPAVSIEELKQVFKRKGTVPHCLQDVFRQMSSEGNLVEKSKFMSAPQSYTTWIVGALVGKPLSWGFGKILGASEDEQSSFVVKSAVRAQGRILIDHIRTMHIYNNIISMDDLMADELDGISKDGIMLVLHHLNTEEKEIYIEETAEIHHKILMKFAAPREPITEIERSIYNLKHTEKLLLKTIEQKEVQLNEILDTVKENLKNGKKQLAKTYLRKKRMMEADIAKNLDIRDNVQMMLQRVKSSKNDRDIIKTYKGGADAIKAAFGINLDHVHDIVKDMQEVFDAQKKIDAALGEKIESLPIDNKELEDELAELMNTNNEKPNEVVANPSSPVLDPLDLELEMRLRRLRSDLTEVDAPLAGTLASLKI